ncbi:hypothetical protein DRQ33_00065 [bacterium]|nr:MAG: hypothetical protein DRQ33_00065 [bacterium]
MKKASVGVILVSILVIIADAVPFGNPADLPGKGKIEISADLSKQFLFTRNDAFSNKYVPHQLFLRLGYTPFEWIMLNGYLGGSDADWYWKPNQIPDEIFLDGSWELSPGAGITILPPVKFTWMDFQGHIFVEAKYFFIRSRYPDFTLPSGLWTLKLTSYLNQFEMGGFAVGYYRKFNISVYGGVSARYVSATARYTAISSRGKPYKGDMLMGNSFGSQNILTIAVFPVVGLNWHLQTNLAIDFEASLLNLEKSGPTVGLAIGISHYK